jgi:hypothetical protein
MSPPDSISENKNTQDPKVENPEATSATDSHSSLYKRSHSQSLADYVLAAFQKPASVRKNLLSHPIAYHSRHLGTTQNPLTFKQKLPLI